MHHQQLDFTVTLDQDERDYVSPSLEAIKSEISSHLDIVDVAGKMGLTVRKLEEQERPDVIDWSLDVYIADCPCCGESDLLIAQETQLFGCTSCNWDGSLTTGNKTVFDFLSQFFPQEFPRDDASDQKMIEKLFALFPEELSFLVGRNLFQYWYRYDYSHVAEGYYPGILADIEILESTQEKYNQRIHSQERNTGDFYKEYHDNDSKLRRLKGIAEAYSIVSRMYAREQRIHHLLSESVKPSDIGLSDNPLWVDESMPQASPSIDCGNVRGILEPLSRDTVGRHVVMREEPLQIQYIEIPDATFRSSLRTEDISQTLPNIVSPFLGEYVIAYSAQDNNFSIFLSEGSKVELGNEILDRNGMYPLMLQYHIGRVVYGASDKYEYPKIILPEGYKQVAFGGFVYGAIGMYFTFSRSTTEFDLDLFRACIKNLEGTTRIPIFIDPDAFIQEYRKEEARLGIPPLRTHGLHVEGGYTYEVA